MVAALSPVLFAAAVSGPVAAFSAPAVVHTGSLVTYVDHSYDPAPGHRITLEIWIGRQSTFATPGSYRVTLFVEDDRGLTASTSRTIVVVATTRPPAVPSAALELSKTRVRRGDSFTVELANAPGAENIRLYLPSAFLQTVTLPAGAIDYAKVNVGQFTASGDGFTTTVWVPWTARSPADGSYVLSVGWTQGGQQKTLSTSIDVAGTDRLAIWTSG